MRRQYDAKILLVDDCVENIDVALTSLGENYDVIVTTEGLKALDIAVKEQPDLILLDILMPAIDGYEVCRKLKKRQETSHIPVIFLTGVSSSENKKKGFEIGAVDYIIKPFETDELKARIKNHVLVKKAQEDLHKQKHLLEMKVEERTFERSEERRGG